MNLHVVRVVSLLCRILGTACFILIYWNPVHWHPWFFLGLSLLFFTISTRLDYLHWRCPHCGKHLGKHMFPFPRNCPNCKEPLDNENHITIH